MKQNIFFFRDAALRAYQGVMTLPRFCGDRKHKSDGIRVAKAEPLSASFSTTSARKRDSFASILNEGCTRPKRWLPCGCVAKTHGGNDECEAPSLAQLRLPLQTGWR